MTLATLPSGTVTGRTRSPDGAVRPRQVGPGWEVLLMPAPLAELVTHTLGENTVAASAMGWTFAHAGHRGIFLPELSDDPAWPPGTTYLKAGASVSLPPFHWRLAERGGTEGWVALNSQPLSKPMLLHPVVTLIAAELAHRAVPTPES
ncbi:hypothetical protein [Streptomyces sp. NPDC088755]|uniref:hypothetical protein n=1 Tax=Streptomyces sp. NPDC088755 TaxID=3365888 RepID=UPI0037FBBC16